MKDANEYYLEQHLHKQEVKETMQKQKENDLYQETLANLDQLKPHYTKEGKLLYHYSVLQDLLTDIGDEKKFVKLAKAIQEDRVSVVGELMIDLVKDAAKDRAKFEAGIRE